VYTTGEAWVPALAGSMLHCTCWLPPTSTTLQNCPVLIDFSSTGEPGAMGAPGARLLTKTANCSSLVLPALPFRGQYMYMSGLSTRQMPPAEQGMQGCRLQAWPVTQGAGAVPARLIDLLLIVTSAQLRSRCDVYGSVMGGTAVGASCK
jgi:hypothetical protein